ncbi:cation channel sperm-associated protein 3-like [Stegostoma tigrinum]|uniref:cation channel sperm-associated protein 3-like n=1 Tax=Stegostoma tigrinum TaxID=3053191 RepID=UPI00202B4C58|nr:cation channel sperm-associated protein 3-like [Stegostoma tigrinum]
MPLGKQIHPLKYGSHHEQTIFDFRRKRRDGVFYNYVKRLTKSWIFKGIIFTTILANSLFMALETDYQMANKFFIFFNVSEQLFLAIYTVEFLTKIYVDPIKYWKIGFNVFDFIVLSLSFIYRFLPLKFKRSLYWLHIVRPLRTLRTISFIRGLQVLSTALVSTLKSVFFVLFLLFLLMTVFALIGYYFYGNTDHGDYKNWGNLRSAFFTLFSLVTLDGWTDLQAETGRLGFMSSRIFIIGFILVACYLFFNLFIGVIIINIRETTKEFNKGVQTERETILLQKKQAILQRQQSHITDLMEKQKTSQFESFSEMVEKFKQTLRHDDYVLLDDLCSSLSFIDIYFTSLDEQDNTLYKLQQLYFETSYVLGNLLEVDRHQERSEKKDGDGTSNPT